MTFELPKLNYALNALEPYIDAETVEIHYSRHHATYAKNFNDALANAKLENLSIGAIFANISKYPTAVRNNGGGYFNHNFYWENIGPGKGGKPQVKLLLEIEKEFGSFEAFKEEFSKTAISRFGSGWAWLIKKEEGNLAVISTANQDNPLMDISETKGIPLLTIDVWEHAYYLKYKNKRPDYVNEFWNIIDWDIVSKRLEGITN
jgi:Fe-Mn family superoxide dismutase